MSRGNLSFLPLNKKQIVKFRILAIRRRVIDVGDKSKVTNSPYIPAGKLKVMPAAILATKEKRLEMERMDYQI